MVINAEMERKQKGRPGVFQTLQKKTHTATNPLSPNS